MPTYIVWLDWGLMETSKDGTEPHGEQQLKAVITPSPEGRSWLEKEAVKYSQDRLLGVPNYQAHL